MSLKKNIARWQKTYLNSSYSVVEVWSCSCLNTFNNHIFKTVRFLGKKIKIKYKKKMYFQDLIFLQLYILPYCIFTIWRFYNFFQFTVLCFCNSEFLQYWRRKKEKIKLFFPNFVFSYFYTSQLCIFTNFVFSQSCLLKF